MWREECPRLDAEDRDEALIHAISVVIATVRADERQAYDAAVNAAQETAAWWAGLSRAHQNRAEIAEARVAALEAAVRFYGVHYAGCRYAGTTARVGPQDDCQCGLTGVLDD
jgi:hypothetical protein